MDRLEAKSTVLAILRGTTAEDAATREQNLRRFCEQYTSPLVAYLHASRRVPVEDAEDLVHEFWTQKLLAPPVGQSIVAKYLESNARGRARGFRKFIFRCLANFQLDHARKMQRRGVTLSLEQLEGWQPTDDGPVDPEFELIWARHIITRVVEEVRKECEQKGQHNKWRLFVACISRAPSSQSHASMSQLAALHGFENAKQAGAALITISRKFERVLNSQVAATLPWQANDEDGKALQAEVAELRKIFSRPGAINLEILGLLEDSQEIGRLEEGASECSMSCLYFDHNWMSHQDLTILWQAMLEQRLAEWLPEVSGPTAEAWRSLRFGDLATWTNPQLDLLRVIHQYAKEQGTSGHQASLGSVSLPESFSRLST